VRGLGTASVLPVSPQTGVYGAVADTRSHIAAYVTRACTHHHMRTLTSQVPSTIDGVHIVQTAGGAADGNIG
jgi:hypothetical protein